MTSQPREPEPPDDSADYSGTPRWVYAFAAVAIVLILLFVILHLTGRGFRGHGP
ncbi:MAG: hypothetical protein WEE89_07320 [Gemmatimonadota bacterium]